MPDRKGTVSTIVREAQVSPAPAPSMSVADLRPGQTVEHHDFRGDIYRFPMGDGIILNLMKTTAGTLRSGDLHNCTQFDVILQGRAKLHTFDMVTQQETAVVYGRNDFIQIPARVPHLFEFLEDNYMVEWWDCDFRAWFYRPYRDRIAAGFAAAKAIADAAAANDNNGQAAVAQQIATKVTSQAADTQPAGQRAGLGAAAQTVAAGNAMKKRADSMAAAQERPTGRAEAAQAQRREGYNQHLQQQQESRGQQQQSQQRQQQQTARQQRSDAGVVSGGGEHNADQVANMRQQDPVAGSKHSTAAAGSSGVGSSRSELNDESGARQEAAAAPKQSAQELAAAQQVSESSGYAAQVGSEDTDVQQGAGTGSQQREHQPVVAAQQTSAPDGASVLDGTKSYVLNPEDYTE